MLIHRYCKRVKLRFLCCISLQREGKWLFLEGSRCLNLILWMACLTFSCTIVQKKRELPYVHSLFKKDSTIYFQCACKKRQGSISSSSARRKKYQRWLLWNQDSVFDFFGRKRIMYMVATLALCLSKGNKEFK